MLLFSQYAPWLVHPDVSAGEKRVVSLYLWHCQPPKSSHSSQKTCAWLSRKKVFFSLMGRQLEKVHTNHVNFYFQNVSSKTFLDSIYTHPSSSSTKPRESNSYFQTPYFFALKITSPPTHPHYLLMYQFPPPLVKYSFWGFFPPWLSSHSEAAEMTIQYLLCAWFTSLPGKISNNNVLGAPTWTTGGWQFEAIFTWPGHHWPAVAQNLSWETEKLLFLFSGGKKCHFRGSC